MEHRFERFSFAITEIYRYWHRISAEIMAKHGLKGSCAVYFAALSRHSEGLTAARLSEICSRNKAEVSRVTRVLIHKGLVEKVNNGSAVYRARLLLTEEGKSVAKSIDQCAVLAADLASDGLDDEQREAFYSSLELIAKNLHDVNAEEIAG